MADYTCPKHNLTQSDVPCPECQKVIESPIPDTHEGRLAELHMWFFDIPILTVDFSDLHGRIEKLMGRQVWTHEFTSPETLYHEMETRQTATFAEVFQKAEDYVGKGNVIPVRIDEEAENG
jgi:hypothetical protein